MLTKITPYGMEMFIENGAKSLLVKGIVISYKKAYGHDKGIQISVSAVDEKGNKLVDLSPDIILDPGNTLTIFELNQILNINFRTD